MGSGPTSSSQTMRGAVAIACALTLSVALAVVWGVLTGITLPALYDAAQADPDQWLAYGFWSLVRLSLPLWAFALWSTAIGSFFETGEFYRIVRRGLWLVPAAACGAAFVVGADAGGLGTRFMIPQGSFEHLSTAEVILP